MPALLHCWGLHRPACHGAALRSSRGARGFAVTAHLDNAASRQLNARRKAAQEAAASSDGGPSNRRSLLLAAGAILAGLNSPAAASRAEELAETPASASGQQVRYQGRNFCSRRRSPLGARCQLPQLPAPSFPPPKQGVCSGVKCRPSPPAALLNMKPQARNPRSAGVF